MSHVKELLHTIKCDNCKDLFQGDTFAFWFEPDSATEEASESGWIANEYDTLHYCPKCFDIDENDKVTIGLERIKP